jgi:hypothetical protein
MPKKKTNTSAESNSEKELIGSEQKLRGTQDDKNSTADSKTYEDINARASELASNIIRELYRHYGAKDSHTNKHLYQEVMFEVSMLSGKPLSEVIDKWPRFDIFSILEEVKEVAKEELRNKPEIVYQIAINSKIIADKILAKVIVKMWYK